MRTGITNKKSQSGAAASRKKGERTIFVLGAGGLLGKADLDAGLAVAFCHNRMMRPRNCEDHPLVEITDVIRESLDI